MGHPSMHELYMRLIISLYLPCIIGGHVTVAWLGGSISVSGDTAREQACTYNTAYGMHH